MSKFEGQASPPPPPIASPSPPPQKPARKIPVVYYLCRNRHLEHPHFIEVPLSSPEGLHLKDVLGRLNVLRGKGMPAMYAWSCKRSYKNGFVWHDLSEDDFILPTNGNEFVLKGSELLGQSPSDKVPHNGAHGALQSSKFPQTETPASSRTNVTSCSSSSTAFKGSKTPSPPSPSPTPLPSSPSNISPKAESPNSAEYRVCNPRTATDASTQTDDVQRRTHGGRKNTCIRGVSTGDGSMDFEVKQFQSNMGSGTKEGLELGRDGISPPPTSSSDSSSGRKMETLESLIRADANKINSFRILEEEEEVFVPAGLRLKATNVLMQLITCGSISVKEHQRFGLVPTSKTKFSHMKFPSPMFSSSKVLAELDYLSENPRFIGLRMEDKEYFSGSLLETKKLNEDAREGFPTFKRSSSFNADRSSKSPHSARENERSVFSSHSKCLPRSVKNPSNKLAGNGTSSSPISDSARNSSAGPDCLQSFSAGGSKRMPEALSVKGSTVRIDSFKEDKAKTIKIEES
ncbi:hypothetical protein KSP40_PGU021397 [Platanthera guangdongensis]|uniref:SOSEKI DIX-like domain-containing protein n=1 Tax=Platanthera guangdongensis TaxID=2320717 RepID=A0ABR2M0T0_9ASPA